MPTAIAAPCLLCGRQFTRMALLVLHIREDHVHAHAHVPGPRTPEDQNAGPDPGPVTPGERLNAGSPAQG